MIMKFCSVYALKEEFYFVTNAKYKDGVGSISLPIFKESKFETKEDLSKRLKECLDAYTLDKELPEKASDLLKPLLKITKCNSYKELVKLSNLNEVAYIDDSIKIQPLARAKNFKGFESYN